MGRDDNNIATCAEALGDAICKASIVDMTSASAISDIFRKVGISDSSELARCQNIKVEEVKLCICLVMTTSLYYFALQQY